MTAKFEMGYWDGTTARQANKLPSPSARVVLDAHPDWSSDDVTEYLNGHEDGLSGDGYRLALGRCQGEIIQLSAVNARLREALDDIAQQCNGYGDVAGWACLRARAALGSEAAAYTLTESKQA